MKKIVLLLMAILLLFGCQKKEVNDPLRKYAIDKAVEYYLDFEEYDANKEYTIHRQRNYSEGTYPVTYLFSVNGSSRFTITVDYHQHLEKPTIKYGDGYLTVDVNTSTENLEFEKKGYVINDRMGYTYITNVVVKDVELSESQQLSVDKRAESIIKSYAESSYNGQSIVYFNCLRRYVTSIDSDNEDTLVIEQLPYVDYPVRVNGKMVAYLRIQLTDLNKLEWSYIDTTDYEIQRMLNQGEYFIELDGNYISKDVKLEKPLSNHNFYIMAQDALQDRLKSNELVSIKLK